MSDFEPTTQNRVRRIPARGHYDKAVIYPIIDEALLCHVGFVEDGVPYVIPTIHARSGDKLFFHGAKASRMMKQIASGAVVCVTFTLLDGLVLARSTFHSSMNYRSAVAFGRGRPLTSDAEKMAALEVLTEHLVRGRWPDTRQPTAKELQATAVAELTIESASAKIRTGPPGDDDADYTLPIWAGVLPIRQQYLSPIDDPRLGEGLAAPEYVVNYGRNQEKDEESGEG